MAINFPGPYELRIYYSTTLSGVTLQHRQNLNVKPDVDPTPGVAFSAIDIENGGAVATDLQTVLDEWIALLKPLFNSGATTFNYAELWKYTPGTFLSSFISSQNISEAGTSGSNAQYAGEEIYIFRSKEGGTMRLTLQEGTIAVGVPQAYVDLAASRQALVDYVQLLSDGQFFLARDTSYPLAFTRMFPGQNEAVFKKRFRP